MAHPMIVPIGELLWSNSAEIMGNVTLPPGNRSDGWKLELTIRVCSIEDDPTCVSIDLINVTVSAMVLFH
jgi:hypothetical protein